MNKQDKRRILEEVETDNFARLNGAIIRTIAVIFHSGWENGQNIRAAFKDKQESDIYSCLDYLQLCGAVKVRVSNTKDEVEINDFELDEVDIRLSDYGIKLYRGVKKDELIEI